MNGEDQFLIRFVHIDRVTMTIFLQVSQINFQKLSMTRIHIKVYGDLDPYKSLR